MSVKIVSADDKSVVVEPTAQVLDLNSVILSGNPTPAGSAGLLRRT